MPTINKNKQAYFDYEVLDEFEAGIVLSGSEVKSIKNGQINLKGSYATIKGNALWLINAHISPYLQSSTQTSYTPTQDRKLLLHKKEIGSLIGKLKTKGLTVLPLSVYTKGSLIKIKVGVCRGKKAHDKRQLIKKRETDKDIRRLLRNK
ncbi:MAG: SsrA-binding protein SmpB [Candidatus Kerfeldbacteria bacterium]|jgi:SsrA-binding protein